MKIRVYVWGWRQWYLQRFVFYPAAPRKRINLYSTISNPRPLSAHPLHRIFGERRACFRATSATDCSDLTGTQTTAPTWLYWDGKILKAKDGKYHLFASRWPASQGHNGGWGNSDIVHAVSDSSPLGPYVDKGYAYGNGPDKSDSHKGHNVSVVQLPDSTYAMVVSEIVPFTIFTSKSLDGPWTNLGHATINTNGVPVTLSGKPTSSPTLV